MAESARAAGPRRAVEGSATGAALALALLLGLRALGPARAGEPPPEGSPPQRGAARLLWGLPLDLNRERSQDLEALPGIGPGRARAIVAGRPYCRRGDLERVPGIGPATLRRIAGRVSVLAPERCAPAQGD